MQRVLLEVNGPAVTVYAAQNDQRKCHEQIVQALSPIVIYFTRADTPDRHQLAWTWAHLDKAGSRKFQGGGRSCTRGRCLLISWSPPGMKSRAATKIRNMRGTAIRATTPSETLWPGQRCSSLEDTIPLRSRMPAARRSAPSQHQAGRQGVSKVTASALFASYAASHARPTGLDLRTLALAVRDLVALRRARYGGRRTRHDGLRR